MNLYPQLTSNENRSASNAEISNQYPLSDHQPDSTNSLPVIRNVLSCPSPKINRQSITEFQQKKVPNDDVALPVIGWNLRDLRIENSTSVDQSTMDSNEEWKNMPDIPFFPEPISPVSNGIKPEPLHVFKSLPKGKNHRYRRDIQL
jgi:hypothetical protein